MTSTIVETVTQTIISTPKKKSWALIIYLSIITLAFTNGIIQSLFFADDITVIERIVTFIILTTVIYFTLKGLLWQIRGVREVTINGDEMKLSKLSPLWTRTKTYRLSEVKNIDIEDETLSEGPLAMYQILKIIDKIKVTFTYGYETIVATSGIDMTEAKELKNKIESRINAYKQM